VVVPADKLTFGLIVHVSYEYQAVLIKFVGTHADCDKIDPGTL
jgi:mRNA interferase HigB